MHPKLLFQQLFCPTSKAKCFAFFMFRHNWYLKKGEISMKKVKIFECWPIFQSFCVRSNILKGFIWVVFHSVSKAQFSSFLFVCNYLYLTNLSKIQWKMRNIFGFNKFYLLWSLIKSYLSVLIWRLFVVFSLFNFIF